MHARKNKEGGNQMKDNELLFDLKSHVLYSKPCKKEIQAKIALHYPEAEREAIWEKVQRQYVDFLSDWRTDLGGKKNLHNGVGDIHFFYSADEVLYGALPDFEEACKRANVPYTVSARPKMVHCYCMLPIFKEAKEDFAKIVDILKK